MSAYSRTILILVAANSLLALWHFLIRPNETMLRTEFPVVSLVHKSEAAPLSLKSEHRVLLQTPDITAVPIEIDSNVESIGAPICLEFSQLDVFAQFSASLDGLALEYSVEEIRVLDIDNPFFRVQTPAFESRDVAIAALQGIRESIERSGVPIDSYIVAAGPLENAISLGLFSDRANAFNVQRVLADQGVNVMVEREGRSTSRYRVVLEREYYFELKEQIDVVAGALMLEISALENLCETIAHAE